MVLDLLYLLIAAEFLRRSLPRAGTGIVGNAVLAVLVAIWPAAFLVALAMNLRRGRLNGV